MRKAFTPATSAKCTEFKGVSTDSVKHYLRYHQAGIATVDVVAVVDVVAAVVTIVTVIAIVAVTAAAAAVIPLSRFYRANSTKANSIDEVVASVS